jgi:UrcA family protein
MKTLIAAAATCALTLTATPAFAAGDPEAPRQSISIRDLDLATPEGQEELERRIDRVAKQICGLDTVRTGTRIRSREKRECYAQAKASASQQVAAMMKRQNRGG